MPHDRNYPGLPGYFTATALTALGARAGAGVGGIRFSPQTWSYLN